LRPIHHFEPKVHSEQKTPSAHRVQQSGHGAKAHRKQVIDEQLKQKEDDGCKPIAQERLFPPIQNDRLLIPE